MLLTAQRSAGESVTRAVCWCAAEARPKRRQRKVCTACAGEGRKWKLALPSPVPASGGPCKVCRVDRERECRLLQLPGQAAVSTAGSASYETFVMNCSVLGLATARMRDVQKDFAPA